VLKGLRKKGRPSGGKNSILLPQNCCSFWRALTDESGENTPSFPVDRGTLLLKGHPALPGRGRGRGKGPRVTLSHGTSYLKVTTLPPLPKACSQGRGQVQRRSSLKGKGRKDRKEEEGCGHRRTKKTSNFQANCSRKR